jgi:rubrerythrin
MADTYQLLDKAERLELLAERLYTALADRFGGEPKALFQRLAAEEAQHAARIRLLAARYRQDRKLVNTVSADISQLDRRLVEAEEALAAVTSGVWDGNPEAALAAAMELERSFCLAHAQALSSEARPELRAFFEQLASQDKAHAALLKG